MTQRVNMIVFGEDWGGLPTSTQHLIRNMPNRGRVLWVNSVGLRSPTLSVGDVKRVAQKLSARVLGLKNQQSDYAATAPLPDMKIIEPKVLPFHRSAVIRGRNGRNLAAQLRPFVESCGDNPPLIWITVPTADVVLAAFPDLPSIYYCCDDFGSLPSVDHKAALMAEARLAEQANCVIVTNELLADRFPASKTTYVAQGVDFENFAAPVARAADMPAGPVAGFFGLIAEWVDQDILLRVARALAPEGWTLLLIGSAACDTSKLETEPNITCLGPRAYDKLSSYAQHWQISLLPFADTPEVRAANPLKLREYLACGAPTLTTPFPAAEPYRQWMTISDEADVWITSCRDALEDSADKRQQRQESVRDESWAARAADILTALNGPERIDRD